jgi:hypothetical protein
MSASRGTVASAGHEVGQAGLMRGRPARVPVPRSSFAGFRFPPDVIMVAVRWYLRYGLSYRDVEELLAERGIEVDHVTIYRWVQQFTPLLIDAARPIGSGYPAAASCGRSTPTRSLDGRNTFIAATECDRLSAPPLYTLPHDPNRPPMQPATLLRQCPSRSPSPDRAPQQDPRRRSTVSTNKSG